MNRPGESQAWVLCVGNVSEARIDELRDFDVRHLDTPAEARELFFEDENGTTAPNVPDCVVSGTLADADSDVDGVEFLRQVNEHTHQVATVLTPGDQGTERLASRAVDAGLSGYCLVDDSLTDVIEAALERTQETLTIDQDVELCYRTLAQNLPNGAVGLYDRDLRYLLVGGMVFDDLSLSQGRLEGKKLEDAHSAEYVEQYGPLYRAALDGTSSTFEFTYEDHTFRGHTVPVRDQSGDIVAGMALTQNITQEHEQRTRLERQNQRLDRFASVVSHDLRTPLNIVQGSLVLLRERAREGDIEAVEKNADRISRACQRMNDIVDNVLELARQPENVDDPDDVRFTETVTQVWSHVNAPSATLDIDLGTHEEVTIRADRNALWRLLENLLTNAIDHGSDHREEAPTVRVEWIDGDEGGFAVEDDGPGLAPDERERVFDWGFTTDQDGIGLGLSIVQDVADAHGWNVSVGESASGGARFEVRGVAQATAETDALTEQD